MESQRAVVVIDAPCRKPLTALQDTHNCLRRRVFEISIAMLPQPLPEMAYFVISHYLGFEHSILYLFEDIRD